MLVVLKSFSQTAVCCAHERQLITPSWENATLSHLLRHHSTCHQLILCSISLSFTLSVHHYHNLTFPSFHSHCVSTSLFHLFLSESITHSDSLCNMPSSKLNSTLLDLQPFPSSKWLTSVITLQPEWETQRRGREEGWQTETWHERRGNAGLIIHTYCSKNRGSKGVRDLEK